MHEAVPCLQTGVSFLGQPTTQPPRYPHVILFDQVVQATPIIAKALLAGGNQAKVFAAALSSAITSGGCGAINNILSRASRLIPSHFVYHLVAFP